MKIEAFLKNARVIRDTEEKDIGGKKFLSTTVACNYKSKGQDKADFVEVLVPLSEYSRGCSKGDVVCCRGDLATNTVEGKDGKPAKTYLSLWSSDFQFWPNYKPKEAAADAIPDEEK